MDRGPCHTLCSDFLFLESKGWKEEGGGWKDDKSCRKALEILILDFPGHEGGSERVERTGSVHKRCFQSQNGSVKVRTTVIVVCKPEDEGSRVC